MIDVKTFLISQQKNDQKQMVKEIGDDYVNGCLADMIMILKFIMKW